MTNQIQPWQEAAAEIWQLFRETDAKFKASQAELDQRFKETNAQFKASQAELNQLFKETDAQFKANQAEFDQRFKETDARFKETDAKIDKTLQALRQAEGLFTSQWGRMLEALVQPSALRIFQDRNIDVQYNYERVKSQRNGRSMELDLLLENGDEIVVLEVKSILKVSVVTEFLEDLAELFDFFPKYRGYKVYAGVAGLTIDENADRYAYRQGLFVLKVGQEGLVRILNDAAFQPKDFSQMSA